eukprot:6800821-Alexandrium_andersonii.AAC.1
MTQRSLLGHAANSLRANCCANPIAIVTQRTCPSKGSRGAATPTGTDKDRKRRETSRCERVRCEGG